MMTRKHYEAIAGILKDNCQHWQDKLALIDAFCLYFKKDNPNFKEDKFKQACNLLGK